MQEEIQRKLSAGKLCPEKFEVARGRRERDDDDDSRRNISITPRGNSRHALSLSLSPLKLSVVSGAVPRFLTADLFSSTRVQFLSDVGTEVGPI